MKGPQKIFLLKNCCYKRCYFIGALYSNKVQNFMTDQIIKCYMNHLCTLGGTLETIALFLVHFLWAAVWKYMLCVFKLLSLFLAHLSTVQPNLNIGNPLFPPQLNSLHSGQSLQGYSLVISSLPCQSNLCF